MYIAFLKSVLSFKLSIGTFAKKCVASIAHSGQGKNLQIC